MIDLFAFPEYHLFGEIVNLHSETFELLRNFMLVKSFQQNRAKLRADGVVGSTTWQAMMNDKNWVKETPKKVEERWGKKVSKIT